MKLHILFALTAISAIGLIAWALMPWAPAAAEANAATTGRVSVNSAGGQGDHRSQYPAISANGRFVAFESDAANLVANDTNEATDIFIHDRQTGTTGRVSIGPGGAQGNSDSYAPAVSADGRFVAFMSDAGNLVPGDTNDFYDIFVHDRQTGATSRVSVGPDGAQGDGRSELPAISADGRFVAFMSDAANLVADDANDLYDIFVHDRQAGVTSRVSVASDGAEGDGESWTPAVSADGRFVAFESAAANLVTGDTNDNWDIFVHDRQTGTTSRVSIKSGGPQGNGDSFAPAVSADGRFVAFESAAANLVSGDTNEAADIFVHDRQAGTTGRVSVDSDGTQGSDGSYGPAISADGRYVAFESDAANLVPGDTNNKSDIFVRDGGAGKTGRVSISSGGGQGDAGSYRPDLSADGRYMAFMSDAANLVLNDTNGVMDVFAHDRGDVILPTSTPTPTVGPSPTATAGPSPTPTQPFVPTHRLYLPVGMRD